MGLFSLEHTWVFPSNNNGQLFGINDSGVETFNGTPIKSLAREICQNSIGIVLGSGNNLNSSGLGKTEAESSRTGE